MRRIVPQDYRSKRPSAWRRCLRTGIVCLIALSVGSVAWGGGQIEVTAAVDKQTAYIGDLINYSVIITYDSTLKLIPPAVGANLGGFDVKDYHVSDEKKVDQGRRQQSLSFNIRTFTTGDYVIPPMPIQYMQPPDSTLKVIAADPIKITIKSVLAEGAEADTLTLRPLKPQVSMAKSRTRLIVAIIGLVVLGAAAAWYFFIYRRRGRVEEVFVDPRPAWEIAFAELAMLREKDYLVKGELKAYYIELTDIFRKYLGKKFDFSAVDMTTEEIEAALGERGLEEIVAAKIVGFLQQADLVKFAKEIPPPERPAQDWETAYALVNETKDIVLLPPVLPEPMPALEPVLAGAAESESSADGLKYAPPQLREYFAAKHREEGR